MGGSRWCALTCFNTQPRRGGCSALKTQLLNVSRFQHTAAQRRLPLTLITFSSVLVVSTHSRAEAAAVIKSSTFTRRRSFNTQPRRGGCPPEWEIAPSRVKVSTHSRAEAAAGFTCGKSTPLVGFNTQPRRGGCVLFAPIVGHRY